MTEHDSAAIAREFFEAWNERDFDRGATLVADDGELVRWRRTSGIPERTA